MKFIYWFAHYNLDSPSVRYRAAYPLEFFRKEKSIGYFLVIPGYSVRKLFLFFRAYLSALLFRKKESLIVIQRVHSGFIYASLLKVLVYFRKEHTVYDLDDADYLECDPVHLYYFSRMCRKVSAGSREIEKHMNRMNHNTVRTPSPIADLGIVKKCRSDVFTIGWIGIFGSQHKAILLEKVFPAVKKLGIPCRLSIIGVCKPGDGQLLNDYFADSPLVELDIPLEIAWHNEEEIQRRITGFDVGIATLADCEFHISKSGIKAKQYLNNAVPVLSTNLPENNSVVIDGYNGYFCSTTDDFREKLLLFASMPEAQYAAFSGNARKSISNFNHEAYFREISKLM